MPKFLFTYLVSFFGFTSLFAQTTGADSLYGSYIDLGGELIHERADQDYSPSTSLTTSFNSALNYSPASYYPTQEARVRGKILFTPGQKHFLFKNELERKRKKIFPSLGWSIKIGADSFIVANNFDLYGKLGLIESAIPEACILLFMAQTEHFAFFQYSPAVGRSNIVVRKLSSQELISLPVNRKAFLEKAAQLFYDYPDLLELLNQKTMDYEQINDLIHFIRYSDALETGRPVGFTSSWNITEEAGKQTYFARVSRPENNWRLDFYNQQQDLIFSEHYAYDQPTVKEGEAIWYYPGTGIARKKTNHTKETSAVNKTLFVYFPNGQLHYRISTGATGKMFFAEVLSEEGNSVYDNSGTGTEEFYDSFSGRTIYREYKNFNLTASWYIDSRNRKIYQLADKNVRLRGFKFLSRSFSEESAYPEADLAEGTEGVVLVKFLITPEKEVESHEILQGLSSTIDAQVEKKLNYISQNIRFKSARHNKENVFQEIIMPVRFTLQRQASNSYYYDNSWMRHQQMMMQMSMPPPAAPNFSRF